jgi:hypothetical protein
MADHEDPIIISDDEEQQQRRPRRASQAYSVWYGQRSNRGRIARERGYTTRERNMLAYLMAVSQLVYPTYQFHEDNARYFREGRLRFIRIPTIVSLAQAMANQLADQRVQMS